MGKLLLRWAISAVAIYVAINIVRVPGLSAEGGWQVYFLVALVLGLANALIAPIIKALTCPLILLTLGLFTLVINALMLWLAGVSVGQLSNRMHVAFQVADFESAFLGALVISIVSFVLSVLTGVHRKDNRRLR